LRDNLRDAKDSGTQRAASRRRARLRETDPIGYVDGWPTGENAAQVGKGEADFALEFAAKIVQAIDNGGAVTVLGGVHVGCLELFAKDEIRSIAELKGRTVGLSTSGRTRTHS
jgi:ABC-type nitrate/sulfonate/bicarbonate transport system substrate-binding protein